MTEASDIFELLQSFKIVLIVILSCLFLYKVLPMIISFYKNMKSTQLMSKSGISDIDIMDGFEFEEYLKVLFKKLGYKPQVTRKTGDFGADLVLKGKNKIVIQAKRYKNNVGLDAVREVYSAQAYYKADESWVITNSHFTKQALALAEACNVKMLDRKDLQKFILTVNPEEKPSEFIN